jgi:hypothetical protein
MPDDTSASGIGGQGPWPSTRRSFLGGVGSTLGIGVLGSTGTARTPAIPRDAGSVFYVVRGDTPGRGRGNGGNGNGRGTGAAARYRVLDGETGEVAFRTDDTAEVAFQFAFDRLEGGGTVVASADTFQFGAPAVMGANTLLTGQGGTRFVASETGTVETILPTDDQPSTLPTGHDLIRIRGDNAAVTDITFDANGTQRANQAVQADGADGVLIANNRTVDGFQMALSFTRCTDVAVVGNEVVDPNWYGITSRAAPAGGDLDLRQSSDVTVARNRVSGMKFNNIAPYNVSNFTVYGNVVFDGGHSLIACSPSQQGAIVANVCRDLNSFAPDPGGEAGIEIEYKRTHLREEVTGTPRARSYDITVTGNQIDGCPVGFLARTVAGPDQDAERARAEDRPYSFSVTGNTISGAADAGIRIRSGADGVLATNTVRGGGANVEVVDGFTDGIQQGLNVTR